MPERSFETADGIGACLLELGWTKEQLGNFPAAMQKMADAMSRGNKEGASEKINFELNVLNDENGGEIAEVTLAGEGESLGPERIGELIEKNELPVTLLTEATTQFFSDENKVILRRKKERAVEMDTIK